MNMFQEDNNTVNYKWKYFIVLNWEDTLNNLVEDKIDEELIICCDVAVAKSFDSTDELLEWVNENTDLKADNGDFKNRRSIFAVWNLTFLGL